MADIQNVALVYLEQPSSNSVEEIAELKELIASAHGKVCLLVKQSRNDLTHCNAKICKVFWKLT